MGCSDSTIESHPNDINNDSPYEKTKKRRTPISP